MDGSPRPDRSSPPRSPRPRNGGPVTRRTQVLIVERDRMARLGLSQILGSDIRINVVQAVGLVSEAEYLPASTRVDVVLLSSTVPDIDGVEGVSRLLTRFTMARVVLLGADDSPALMIAALRAGADGYLPREISPDALARALHGVAGGEIALPRTFIAMLVTALRTGPDLAGAQAALSRLSPREQDVLTEIARGRSNAEIATRLGLKESTVKTHVSNILRKTGARSRFALQRMHRPDPPST